MKHVKICYYIFLSVISVEKAQYNSCCFFVKKKKAKITMQWSHVKTFEFVCYCFYCLTSIFVLFRFCETNVIFSERFGLEGNLLFMVIYIPMKSSILSLEKKCNFLCEKGEEKSNILTDYKRSYFPKSFSCFE